MKIIKPLATEISFSAANSINNATLVRLFNDSEGIVEVTHNGTGGSFSIPLQGVEIVQKSAEDTLTASGTIKATKIAFAN